MNTNQSPQPQMQQIQNYFQFRSGSVVPDQWKQKLNNQKNFQNKRYLQLKEQGQNIRSARQSLGPLNQNVNINQLLNNNNFNQSVNQNVQTKNNEIEADELIFNLKQMFQNKKNQDDKQSCQDTKSKISNQNTTQQPIVIDYSLQSRYQKKFLKYIGMDIQREVQKQIGIKDNSKDNHKVWRKQANVEDQNLIIHTISQIKQRKKSCQIDMSSKNDFMNSALKDFSVQITNSNQINNTFNNNNSQENQGLDSVRPLSTFSIRKLNNNNTNNGNKLQHNNNISVGGYQSHQRSKSTYRYQQQQQNQENEDYIKNDILKMNLIGQRIKKPDEKQDNSQEDFKNENSEIVKIHSNCQLENPFSYRDRSKSKRLSFIR